MAKVITFSRVFPSYHPRAGEPTYFVEKIINSLGLPEYKRMTAHDLYSEDVKTTQADFLKGSCNPLFNHLPKYHTIRAGHRWKVGDMFSPRVWSGKPYRSKQIQFAPDIEIKKVWDVEFDGDGCFWIFSDKERGANILYTVAKNDGLSLTDMMSWFNKPFTGQIIAWNENINY